MGFSKRGVVAEILVIVVILASLGMLLLTFENSNDTPNISRAVFDAVIDLRERISQGLLAWLAEGISDEPLACNGLYPLSNDIPFMEEEIFATITPYLPDEEITDGAVTIDLGSLTGVSLDDGRLRVLIDQGGVVYDDGAIYAEDELSQDLSFPLRIPYFLDRVENWTLCDHGALGDRMSEALGEECFYGKRKVSCGEVEQQSIGQSDIDFMLADGPSVSKVASAVARSIDELNAYFNGSDSCGGQAMPESGITCRFELYNLSVINDIYPYSSELSINPSAVVGPRYELSRFLGGITDRVNLLPATRQLAHYQDYELDCPADARVVVPSSVTYSDTVNPLLEHNAQDIFSGDFDVFAYPTLFVNTTRGARYDVRVTCNDPSTSLLGNPVEYSFEFRYGVKQHCGPPDALIHTADEPVCRPCGVPPQVDLASCVSLPCSPKVALCEKALNWLRVFGNDFYSGDAYDYLAEIYAGGEEQWQEYLDQECAIDQNQLDVCAGGVKSHNVVCCQVPGYVSPEDDRAETPGLDDSCTSSFDVNNSNCFMDLADYVSLCTGPSSCGTVSTWQINEWCVDTECVPDSGEGSCQPKPPEEAYKDGRSCGGTTGCYWCSDGSDGQEAGKCLFNPTKEGDVCDDSAICSANTCQASYQSRDPGCWPDPSENAPAGTNCAAMFQGFPEMLLCKKASCDGSGDCDREFDFDLAGTICKHNVHETFSCPGSGTYTCTYDMVCDPDHEGCVRDDDSVSCGTCPTGGGGCIPGSDGC